MLHTSTHLGVIKDRSYYTAQELSTGTYFYKFQNGNPDSEYMVKNLWSLPRQGPNELLVYE